MENTAETFQKSKKNEPPYLMHQQTFATFLKMSL